MLALSNASVHYAGQTVLRDVSLQIGAGEKVALVGRSGAGKSTLLRLLYEQHPLDVALVPQDLGLVNALSVFHNVYMGRLNRHGALYNLANLLRPFRSEVAAVLPILRRLDLDEKLYEPAGQLSGGQQQRTAVARALHHGGAVLMGDEPVSAVDEHQSRRVLDAIVEGHDTVVLAMHDTALAIAYSNRIIGLDDGRITLDASSDGMRPGDLDELYGG
ncbi:MAG: phosphonate transport system ATP-binding protein [Gammaproteobacteria bacterium]